MATIDWDDARFFLAVVEAGSLSAAAKALRVAQPTVSRRLADLEARLGEPLFVRSADGAALTVYGERLVEPARRMAEWAAELERAAEGRETSPRGVVRLTTAPGLAFDFCTPFAGWLKGELPDVRIEIVSTVQYLDLVRREADLALRIEHPSERDLVTLASIAVVAVPFASRAYAAKLGKRPRLEDVDFIGWTAAMDHLAPNTHLARAIPGWVPAFASDDYLVQLRAAEVGLGVVFLARARHRFSRDIGLVEVDIGIPPVPSSVHLVAAKSSLAIPRVRAVADHLARELERVDTGRSRARKAS